MNKKRQQRGPRCTFYTPIFVKIMRLATEIRGPGSPAILALFVNFQAVSACMLFCFVSHSVCGQFADKPICDQSGQGLVTSRTPGYSLQTSQFAEIFSQNMTIKISDHCKCFFGEKFALPESVYHLSGARVNQSTNLLHGD